MNENRRKLEEMVISLLLKEIKLDQINSLILLIGCQYLSNEQHSYLENQVYPLLFSNMTFLKQKKIISNNQIEILKKNINYFEYAMNANLNKSIEEFYLDDFKLFLDDLVYYIDCYKEKYDDKILLKLEEILTTHETKDYCSIFHEEFYQKISNEKREFALNKFKSNVKFLCNEVFVYGCPNLFYLIENEEDKSINFITITIILKDAKNEVKIKMERTVILSMTIYSLAILIMIDFNINIDLYDLSANESNKIEINPTIYHKPLKSLITQSTGLTLRPKPEFSKYNNDIYWSDDNNLSSNIKELYDIWTSNFQIIDVSKLFSNINSPKLNVKITSILNSNESEITKESLFFKINEYKNQLCLLHLIIGFKLEEDKSIKPYLRNINPEDLPYYYKYKKENPDLFNEFIFFPKDNNTITVEDELKTLLFYSLNSNLFDNHYIPNTLDDLLKNIIGSFFSKSLFTKENNPNFPINPKIERLIFLSYQYYINQKTKHEIPQEFHKLIYDIINRSNCENLDYNRFSLYCLFIQENTKNKEIKSKQISNIYQNVLVFDKDIKNIAFQIFKDCDDSIKGDILNNLLGILTNCGINDEEYQCNLKYLISYIEIINKLQLKIAINESINFEKISNYIFNQVEGIITQSKLDQKTVFIEEALHQMKILFLFSPFYCEKIKQHLQKQKGFHLKLMYLLFYINKCIDVDNKDEIQSSIYYFLMIMEYEKEEYHLMKISNMEFKAYFIFNLYLHFYFCNSIRNVILSSNSEEFNNNFHYQLFNEMHYSHPFSFDLFYHQKCHKRYKNNAMDVVKSIAKGFIQSFPSLGKLLEEQSSFEQMINEYPTIFINEYSKINHATIDELSNSKKNYELRSILVIRNENIPLASSYVYVDNEWFRFHTQFQKVNKNRLNTDLNNWNNQIILFWEAKHKENEMKNYLDLKIAQLLSYPNIKELFTQNFIQNYSYYFFELSLRNNKLINLLSNNDTNQCQIRIIKLLKTKLLTGNYEDLFEKYKNYINNQTNDNNLQQLKEVVNQIK